MRRKMILIFIVTAILLTGCKQVDPHERTEFMMDTVMNLKIYDGQNDRAMDQAIERLEDIEKTMSAHLDDSDLSKINNNAGVGAVSVDSELYKIIENALRIAEDSNGAYEPTIGPLVDLWNIKDGELERESLPSEEEIRKAKSLVDYRKVELGDNNEVYLKEKGMKLDLGGIVKGYAADEVKDIFIENGVESAIIDLGGNIYVLGKKPNNDMWNIGIQNPRSNSGEYLGILKMDNQTIVTSGDYERYFDLDGERYHHIIDAKTGYPSRSNLLGISIVGENSQEADALSTAVFVMGLDEGRLLLDKYPNLKGIYVTDKKEIYLDPGLDKMFEKTGSEYSLIENLD